MAGGRTPTMMTTALSRPSRGALFALVIVLHLVAIVLLLRSRSLPSVDDTQPVLIVFDVFPSALPPPPPVYIPSRRPPPAPRSGGPKGGAPLRQPAPIVTAPAGPRPVIDATIAPAMPSLPPPAIDLGAALSGTEAAAGGGAGVGSGRGTGIGDGDGAGGGTRWRRAEWIIKPTSDEILSFWPRYPRAKKIGGTVELACIVPEPGPVTRCTVIRERPRGMGFGRAAVAMSPLFRVRPVVEDRRDRADIPVLIPVIFHAPVRRRDPLFK